MPRCDMIYISYHNEAFLEKGYIYIYISLLEEFNRTNYFLFSISFSNRLESTLSFENELFHLFIQK